VKAYARILRVPHMRPLFLSMLLARLPIGLNGLATVLFLRERTGSFAVAGAAAGGLALGSALFAPFNARLVDRFGPHVLFLLAALHAVGLLGLVEFGETNAPTAALVSDAVLTGALLPPVSSVMRALYPRLLHDQPDLVRGAYALDSVLTESIFIAGPLLIAALVALLGPEAALVLSAAAVIAGSGLFLAVLPRGEAGVMARGKHTGSRLGALRAPGVRTLLFSMLPVGFSFGALEVALPAFASDRGRPELSGVLIAIWSVASAGGGLVYGARLAHVSLSRVHVGVALLLPLSFLPLVLAGPIWTMALLVLPGGVLIAPLIASRNELAGVVAPRGSETEAFTWPLTALVGGVSLGAAAAGGLVEASGWRAAILAGTLAAALGAGIALARRATLEPVQTA
jgi:MFS family permease